MITNYYHWRIAEATGERDEDLLNEIEETMCYECDALDCLTGVEFNQLARIAQSVVMASV
jgi:phage regulator Rha-like protein